jgi:beta-N-acetylhexosaminidase
VQPLAGVLDEIPAAATLTDRSEADVEAAAAERGEMLRDLGIGVAFAPVVDVGAGAGIGDRSFSDDPDVVAAYAGAYARGLRSAGVLPVLKHFPGHGQASGDSHDGASSTPVLADLQQVDLVPYDVLLAEPPVGVMVGHLDVPGFTENDVPASVSPAAVGLLRGSYEFDGIVFTDDLVAMDAVTSRFTVPEAVERALIAGVDMPLLARDTDVGAVLDRLTEAVQAGRLSETRIAAALDRIVDASGCENLAD